MDNPAKVNPRGLLGRAILVTLTDVGDDAVPELNHWYNTEHIDDLLSLPGFLRARRYGALDGRPRFIAIYEVDDINALTAPGYMRLLANQSPWSRKIIASFTHHRRMCGTITVDASRGLGGAIGVLRILDTEDTAPLRDYLATTGFPMLVERFGVHGGFLAEADLPAINAPLTQLGLSLPEATDPECFLVVEGQTTTDTDAALAAIAIELDRFGMSANVPVRGSYSLLYANQANH